MQFEFDPSRAVNNVRKHGVSFADAEGVFFDPPALHIPDPEAAAEERFVAIGLGSAGDLLVVVYTLHGDRSRPISARRATGRERKSYEG
ncbi:MAG: BrnT family toxin [Pseudomonadota bacterium]